MSKHCKLISSIFAAPEAQYALYKEPRVKIWRPFLFTVSVSVGSFGLAEYYNRNKLRIRFVNDILHLVLIISIVLTLSCLEDGGEV